MRRREFITLLGGAAVMWPHIAHAQQPPMPVIGFLSFRSANESAGSVTAFRQGLSDGGFSEGRDVRIVLRWADGEKDRLPALAAELIDKLRVSVIVAAGGGPSAFAAKAATKTIPIVFTYAADPVQAGIVASLNRPEGNITGIAWFGGDLAGKCLAFLHDVVPTMSTAGLLTNPSNPEEASQRADAQDAARRFNLKLVVMNASNEREIDAAFATFAQQGIGALVVASDPFLFSRRTQIVSLATRYPLAAMYREFATAGGLMSYGNSVGQAYRHAGLYVGRILKGAKPSDLPVERLTKFELIINLKTAKSLGVAVPAALFTTADEVIE
jgi:putative tryptophan/tyrosine transport system substrate-binding protein